MAKNKRTDITWDDVNKEVLPDGTDGIPAYLYTPSNMIKRRSDGHILRPPIREDGSYWITKENASELIQRRYELRREAMERGLVQGTRAADTAEAMQILAAHQARLAIDTDQGRASTEAAKWILKQAGYAEEEQRAVNAIQINVSIAQDIDNLEDLEDVIDASWDDPF